MSIVACGLYVLVVAATMGVDLFFAVVHPYLVE